MSHRWMINKPIMAANNTQQDQKKSASQGKGPPGPAANAKSTASRQLAELNRRTKELEGKKRQLEADVVRAKREAERAERMAERAKDAQRIEEEKMAEYRERRRALEEELDDLTEKARNT